MDYSTFTVVREIFHMFFTCQCMFLPELVIEALSACELDIGTSESLQQTAGLRGDVSSHKRRRRCSSSSWARVKKWNIEFATIIGIELIKK